MSTVEPITSGTISGAGLNAVVEGGTAFPIFYESMTIERPDIIVYGNTDKNGSFFATLKGVGSPVDQYVSIVSCLPTQFLCSIQVCRLSLCDVPTRSSMIGMEHELIMSLFLRVNRKSISVLHMLA